jgi:hypothetical protein
MTLGHKPLILEVVLSQWSFWKLRKEESLNRRSWFSTLRISIKSSLVEKTEDQSDWGDVWQEKGRLSPEQKEGLIRLFSMEEVEKAIREMMNETTPGHGFPGIFYKKFWGC